MTKTEELLALADALKTDRSVSHRPFRYTCDKAAAALREFAGTMAPEPVGTVTHAGHVDWYDQPPPAVWTKLYLHPPAPTTQEPVAWIGPYKSAWDALNELRKSCAEIIGTDPKTWPNHGNAPLAIAVTLAIARTHMEQGNHPPAPTTQEPVAWGRTVRSIINLTDPAVYGSERVVIAGKDDEGAFPLFTHPPSPMTLTQDQIMEYVREAGLDWHRGWIMGEPPVNRYEEFARAVLAAQQEKK